MKRTGNTVFLVSLAAFALLSAVSGLRWLRDFDSWVLQAAQSPASERLDTVAALLSVPGSVVVSGGITLALAVWLYRRRYRRLGIGLVIAFLGTGLLEVLLKFLLPQVPIPEETVRVIGQAPLIEFSTPYPYPSGHMLRSMIWLGAIFVLWKNSLLRILIALALVGVAWSLVYLGVHWVSDVLGGALLGIAGLAWVFRQSAGQQKQEADKLKC